MELDEFDYELPSELIAQRPLAERAGSRLLLLGREAGTWEDRQFCQLPMLLRGNELLVVNNARVVPARLLGHRAGIHAQPAGRRSRSTRSHLRATIEILLVREIEPGAWEALVRPGRKVRVGERILFGDGAVEAEILDRGAYGLRRVRFSGAKDVREILERLGHIPLPPYIKRADDAIDRERYQTVFAKKGLAVAAPTAGLHFSEHILEQLHARGIAICELTLDVGLGTFAPIRTQQLERHQMHREAYEIPESTAAAIEHAKRERRPVLAVGTTVVRALEDAAQKSAFRGDKQLLKPGRAEADLFIYPGHAFRVVDQLLTNFHLPTSSLLILVAAFAGRDLLLRAYRHAVEESYRFYSYGDCMLIRGSISAGHAV